MPGPKKVKIRPDSSHRGPNSRRIRSLPTKVRSAPTPMPTNATTDSALRRYCLYWMERGLNRLKNETATTVRDDVSRLPERANRSYEGLRLKAPSYEEIVHVPGAVVDGKAPVNV